MTPKMSMFVFLLRHTTCSDLSCCGCTASTCGDRSSIAFTSSIVIFLAMFVWTPPCEMRCASICSTVVPRRAMRSLTDACAPSPSAIIVITAATPITMPSIVSSERSTLARSASSAIRTTSSLMLLRLLLRGLGLLLGGFLVGGGFLLLVGRRLMRDAQDFAADRAHCDFFDARLARDLDVVGVNQLAVLFFELDGLDSRLWERGRSPPWRPRLR